MRKSNLSSSQFGRSLRCIRIGRFPLPPHTVSHVPGSVLISACRFESEATLWKYIFVAIRLHLNLKILHWLVDGWPGTLCQCLSICQRILSAGTALSRTTALMLLHCRISHSLVYCVPDRITEVGRHFKSSVSGSKMRQ